MALNRDLDGLEGLPLKLMIVALVAAMSVLPAGQALESLRSRDFMARAQAELESIILAAQTLAMEGPGSARTLHLDFRGEGRASFERLCIGDSREGPNRSSAVMRLTGGGFLIRTAAEPAVWLASMSKGTMVIETLEFDLRLSARIDMRTVFVSAELV